MKSTMIVVADLGSLKAFKVEENRLGNSLRLEPYQSAENTEVHRKRNNTLTIMEGKSGNTPNTSKVSATASDGEQHNMQLEKRRRSIKQMAASLEAMLRLEKIERCLLAAPKEIHRQLLDALEQRTREKVEVTLPLDLTNADKSTLLEHFMANGARVA